MINQVTTTSIPARTTRLLVYVLWSTWSNQDSETLAREISRDVAAFEALVEELEARGLSDEEITQALKESI
jgi:hypothetical protein